MSSLGMINPNQHFIDNNILFNKLNHQGYSSQLFINHRKSDGFVTEAMNMDERKRSVNKIAENNFLELASKKIFLKKNLLNKSNNDNMNANKNFPNLRKNKNSEKDLNLSSKKSATNIKITRNRIKTEISRSKN
jgi:hypothetical protein